MIVILLSDVSRVSAISFLGNCRYGEELAEELVAKLQNVLWGCGSIRISFSRRTPEKVSPLSKHLLNVFL